MPSERKLVLGLVAWTFIVWLGRIRNIITDDTLGGFEFAWSLGVAVTFCALAAAALASNRGTESQLPTRILAFVSVAYWLVRGVQIGFGDHEAAFIVVHTALASVSAALGGLVLVSQRQNSERSPTT